MASGWRRERHQLQRIGRADRPCRIQLPGRKEEAAEDDGPRCVAFDPNAQAAETLLDSTADPRRRRAGNCRHAQLFWGVRTPSVARRQELTGIAESVRLGHRLFDLPPGESSEVKPGGNE